VPQRRAVGAAFFSDAKCGRRLRCWSSFPPGVIRSCSDSSVPAWLATPELRQKPDFVARTRQQYLLGFVVNATGMNRPVPHNPNLPLFAGFRRDPAAPPRADAAVESAVLGTGAGRAATSASAWATTPDFLRLRFHPVDAALAKLLPGPTISLPASITRTSSTLTWSASTSRLHAPELSARRLQRHSDRQRHAANLTYTLTCTTRLAQRQVAILACSPPSERRRWLDATCSWRCRLICARLLTGPSMLARARGLSALPPDVRAFSSA